MSEEKRAVRLKIESRMTDPEGQVHTMKNARRGTLKAVGSEIEIEYDDEQDGEKAHILLTVAKDRARMRRMGMMSGELRFLPGQRVGGTYVSMYGEIPVAVDTRRVALETDERGGRMMLDYDVYVAGDKTSATLMEVTWRL